MMFNKLYTKILDSSIWLEPTSTRIVWITLLAAMDQDGYAHFSAIENLALRARVSVAEAEEAVRIFTSPDINSANPTNKGRRIERVPGGFLVLNAKEHRDTMNREMQREQTRQRVARHRENKKLAGYRPPMSKKPGETVSIETGQMPGDPPLVSAPAQGTV